MSENGNPQMLRTAKIKITQIKNPKFSARVFRFSIFSFYKATFRVYNTNTVYYIYINILNRIEAGYG